MNSDFYPRLAIIGGLILFGLVFAMNSSIQSFLILAYTDQDSVALNVGFYYMANACGRLAGTLITGVAYWGGGLSACLWASSAFVLGSRLLALRLPQMDPPLAEAGEADASRQGLTTA